MTNKLNVQIAKDFELKMEVSLRDAFLAQETDSKRILCFITFLNANFVKDMDLFLTQFVKLAKALAS